MSSNNSSRESNNPTKVTRQPRKLAPNNYSVVIETNDVVTKSSPENSSSNDNRRNAINPDHFTSARNRVTRQRKVAKFLFDPYDSDDGDITHHPSPHHVTNSEATTGSRLTATNQENLVEDVIWINNDTYQKPEKSFLKMFTKALRVTDMSGRAKLFLRNRYLYLFDRYDHKHRFSRRIHNGSRIFITLGTLIVPALVMIDDEISDRPPLSQTIYYVTVGITLAVSIVNALSELLQCSKRFYSHAATKYLLEQEGWSFLLLRGRYKVYPNHRYCWQTFLHNIERIHQNTAATSLLLHRNPVNNGRSVVHNKAQNPIEGAFNPDFINDDESTGGGGKPLGSENPFDKFEENIVSPPIITISNREQETVTGVGSVVSNNKRSQAE